MPPPPHKPKTQNRCERVKFPSLFLTLEFTIQVQQTNETRPNLVIVNVKPSENEKFKAMVLPEMT